MNASENNAWFDGSNARFLNRPAMYQQPYPGFWYQNYAYNPFFVPGAGSRNGSQYYPYSMALNGYPGPAPPATWSTTLNHRPPFPVGSSPTYFWHCGGYGKNTKTKETQTELQQVQHPGISRSSCESQGVADNTHECEDSITHRGEQRAVGSEQGHEMLKSGLTMEVGKEEGFGAVTQFLPPPDEVKDRDESCDTQTSDSDQRARGVGKLQERPLCTSTEAAKDLSLQSRFQKPDTCRGSHGSSEKWEEEEVGEQNCHPQGTQLDKADEAIQCDGSWWQEGEVESSPKSSPGSSRKGSGEEKSVQGWELDEEDSEQDSYTLEPQFDKIDIAIQCGRSWWQDERSPETSPGDRNGTGEEKSVQGWELDEDTGEQDSYPQTAVPSIDWLSQFNEVETVQCDKSCQYAALEKSPGQVTLANGESSAYSTTQGSRKKNRKISRAEQAQYIFANRKIVYLKKNAVLQIVLPDDSDDCEMEKEEYEVEWLFKEVRERSSAKEKFYQEACKASKVECFVTPELVWPWPFQNYESKYPEYEHVPILSMTVREMGHEVVYTKLRTGHTAKEEESFQESLESDLAEYKDIKQRGQEAGKGIRVKISQLDSMLVAAENSSQASLYKGVDGILLPPIGPRLSLSNVSRDSLSSTNQSKSILTNQDSTFLDQ